jgi:hypothetical protein
LDSDGSTSALYAVSEKVFIDRQLAATRPHPEDWFFMFFSIDSIMNAVVRFFAVML